MWTAAVLLLTAIFSTVMSLPTPDEDRMVQPLSAAASGNYTISFMPLLTVLVNMFPRLLTRVRLQPLTTTTHARKLEALWEWERDSLCQMLETSTTEDPCHVYSCSYNRDNHCPPPQESVYDSSYKHTELELVTMTMIDECTSLEVKRCLDPTYRYNAARAACEPMDPSEQAKCQQHFQGHR